MIGGARHRIQIKTIVRNADGAGGYARADTNGAAVWGEIMPASAIERAGYDQLYESASHVIRLRYRTDIAQGMTLTHDGVSYYVMGVLNEDMRKRFIRCFVRTGGPV